MGKPELNKQIIGAMPTWGGNFDSTVGCNHDTMADKVDQKIDIKAVSHVEAPAGGFIAAPDNRPVILFESHAFHTLTKGIYDNSHPGISTDAWVKNYGASGSHQYDRLNEALALNRDAALQAASW